MITGMVVGMKKSAVHDACASFSPSRVDGTYFSPTDSNLVVKVERTCCMGRHITCKAYMHPTNSAIMDGAKHSDESVAIIGYSICWTTGSPPCLSSCQMIPFAHSPNRMME